MSPLDELKKARRADDAGVASSIAYKPWTVAELIDITKDYSPPPPLTGIEAAMCWMMSRAAYQPNRKWWGFFMR